MKHSLQCCKITAMKRKLRLSNGAISSGGGLLALAVISLIGFGYSAWSINQSVSVEGGNVSVGYVLDASDYAAVSLDISKFSTEGFLEANSSQNAAGDYYHIVYTGTLTARIAFSFPVGEEDPFNAAFPNGFHFSFALSYEAKFGGYFGSSLVNATYESDLPIKDGSYAFDSSSSVDHVGFSFDAEAPTASAAYFEIDFPLVTPEANQNYSSFSNLSGSINQADFTYEVLFR